MPGAARRDFEGIAVDESEVQQGGRPRTRGEVADAQVEPQEVDASLRPDDATLPPEAASDATLNGDADQICRR